MHRLPSLVTHMSLSDCTSIHLTGVPTASFHVVSSLLLLLMLLRVTFVFVILLLHDYICWKIYGSRIAGSEFCAFLRGEILNLPSLEAQPAYVPQQQGEGVTEQPTGVGSSLWAFDSTAGETWRWRAIFHLHFPN